MLRKLSYSRLDSSISFSFDKWKINCDYDDLSKIKKTLEKEGIFLPISLPENKLFGKLNATDIENIHKVCSF